MTDARYLVLSELFMPTKGGTAVWFAEVYRRLGGAGTHIVTARVPGDADYDRTQPNSVHRVTMRESRWLRPASLPRYLGLLRGGLAAIARARFSAVHAGRVLPEGLVAWLLARLIRRPLVVYAHGEEITTWSRYPRRLWAMRWVYRRAERVVANSDFTRERLLELGVRPARIRLIHPGVDLARFHTAIDASPERAELGLGEGARLILSVGRLSRRKGFDRVIEALPALRAQGLDVHYAVIGIGEDQHYLETLAARHGCAERVHLLGHVAPEALPCWYAAADLFAMPNREIDGDTEGFGMVFLEAAACGTPSLAGRAGGTGAAVLDGETGLRVEGADAEAVSAALARLLGDPLLLARMGEAAAARAHAAFSWERVAELTRTL
ncbi:MULTISPECIES: glycosyltransferase family 4 protein [Marichromatium]|uniref:Phosphatidylinositol alpha-1,6-mannosyltransferase n=1 Tax=Marichromatium gracile TaxID=1048 RepID=A0A4R4A8K7_MARGR|nr:glycosyltransferase family 4 protein [Marichromatium gracile]MBK1707979.1 glycosyl transferase [Marichromatium gracile]TCW35105.1 phosphatidylinositol alpha-1,6-mannosyltransferase [Marichromatium gracile]